MEEKDIEEYNENNNASFSNESNEFWKLKNNLMQTSFFDCIEKLRSEETSIFKNSMIEELYKNQKLDVTLVPENSTDFIYQQYLNTQKKFYGKVKFPKISFGLSRIYSDIYLYIIKEKELSLEYIRNYNNITPVDFGKYVSSNKDENESKISNNRSELFKNAGPNLGGYSFEFNINYFMEILYKLNELPNLIFNLNKSYLKKGFFHELDIAYFNEKINNCSSIDANLLRTSFYGLIKKDGSIKSEDNKQFEIFNKSLIIGEIKSKFPKKVFSNDKFENLEDIINNLFFKLDLFYQLYNKIKIYEKIKHIQIIFFYDYIQLQNIDKKTISRFIQNNVHLFSNLVNKINIHFYIVYTLPAITNLSIYNLTNEIKELKK